MRERWGDLARGIGDDAAVLDLPRGERLVLSTDTAIENVHFRRAWLTPREIAYRAVVASLSDLAAMAAQPLGVLVSIAIPEAFIDDLRDIADGIGDAVRASRTFVLGGNLSRGDALCITTTVAGSAFAPLSRTGTARAGSLYVTGRLGGPAAALRALAQNDQPDPAHRERLARPVPRLREARWLAAAGAVGGIDISDGLVADAGHLAAANDAAVEIEIERVPVLAGASENDALAGGEEYELLVVAVDELAAGDFETRFSLPLTRIGRLVQGSAEVRLLRAGSRVAAPGGYEHFSR